MTRKTENHFELETAWFMMDVVSDRGSIPCPKLTIQKFDVNLGKYLSGKIL